MPPRKYIETIKDAYPGTSMPWNSARCTQERGGARGQHDQRAAQIEDVDERSIAERRDGVHERRRALADSVGAPLAVALVDRYGHLLEAGEHPQACQTDFAVTVSHELRHIAPRHQADREHIPWNRLIQQGVIDRIGDVAGQALEEAAPSSLLNAVDDVGAGRGERPVEVDQPGGIFFQIRIDREDQVAGRGLQSREDRFMVPKVSRQVDDPDAAVFAAASSARSSESSGEPSLTKMIS